MMRSLDRAAYVPAGATPFDTSGTDAQVWLYTDAHERLLAIGFHGRASKPDFYLRFRSEERRAEYLAEYLDGRRRRAAMVAERRAKQSEPHTLTVGSILHTSWGYDQTNVEFFEVTRIVGPHTVELRELQQESTTDGFMQGSCRPVPGAYLSRPAITRRVRGSTNAVRITDSHDAWPWDGQTERWSSYA